MSNPVFQYIMVNPFGLGGAGNRAMVDIDGDSDLDVFIGGNDGAIQFLRNTGTDTNPSFSAPSTNPFSLNDVGSIAAPTFVDIDDDGDLDAFIGNNGGNTRFFRNEGTVINPVFVAAGTNPFGLTDVGFRASPAFADIDSDGDLDAFIGNGRFETLFFQNTGTPSNPIFAPANNSSFGLAGFPHFVDIDNDGDLDAFSTYLGVIVFFRNIGTIKNPNYNFDNFNPFGLGGGYFSNFAAGYSNNFADIDNDGDLDAFVGRNDDSTLFFQNIGSGYSP